MEDASRCEINSYSIMWSFMAIWISSPIIRTNVIPTPFCYALTCLPLVPHICISELAPHLVQVMACRVFGPKPLPEPILPYFQLDPWKQTSVKFDTK